MKLKQFLSEELANVKVSYKNIFGRNINIDIFENPTLNQLKKAGDVARAVKLKNGKIYITSDQEVNGIIHEDLVKILNDNGYISNKHVNDWWKNPDSLDEFACIITDKRKWAISESYSFINSLKSFNKLIGTKYKNVSMGDYD